MMNVDLTSAQFNLVELFDEAKKLGLDLEDLTEYGFDEHGLRCAQAKSSCKDYDRITSFDKVAGMNTEIGKKVAHKMIDQYEKI